MSIVNDSKGLVMAQALALAPRRIVTPVAAFLMTVVFAAALALGFGIRTWTEDTARPAAPAPAVHASPSHALQPTSPATAQALRKLGRPF